MIKDKFRKVVIQSYDIDKNTVSVSTRFCGNENQALPDGTIVKLQLTLIDALFLCSVLDDYIILENTPAPQPNRYLKIIDNVPVQINPWTDEVIDEEPNLIFDGSKRYRVVYSYKKREAEENEAGNVPG